ncbi:HET-6OR heterokaryon incompatibility protein (het-6OR allele) [Echria macrotheca]|uniref:HET-6OR heterokaryon incompatibility protein (Het-6OR allele) n=1 Tax=Echria macrotheca TaxID=438768 RepID=A0AAJ0B808_9PEZI|nr:HET-6OR heterokaryon incompatibility protein (het-6OR allele) [Echria macrotheca]
MERFNYDLAPLDDASTQIRLISLSPSPSWSAPLQCRITTASLHPPSQPFKALSYVWTTRNLPRDTTYPLQILTQTDSPSPTHHLPITISLEAALRSLRHPSSITVLWIDQISINQSSIPEKTLQVSLMGKIYASATQVLVWLGHAADGSDLIMDFFAETGAEARAWGMEGYYTRERSSLLTGMVHNISSSPAEDETTTTLELQKILIRAAERSAPLLRAGFFRSWFRRAWFSRVWVVQEFALCADTVFVCGTKEVDVDLVKMAVQVLQFASASFRRDEFACLRPPGVTLVRHQEVNDEPSARLFSVRARRQNYVLKKPGSEGDKLHVLLRKLFVGRDTEATEHRDRVFGLLGLAVDAEELGVRVDYTPGAEATARVLTDVARAMILKGGRVDVLCYAQFPKLSERQVGVLPSWVPDWRSGLSPSYYTITETVDPHLYAASGEGSVVEGVDPPDGKKGDVLGLRGYVVDTIEQLVEDAWTNMLWDHVRYLRYFTQFEALYQASLEKTHPIHSRERKEESRWRVPIGDVYWSAALGSRRATTEAAIEHTRCVDNVNEFHAVMLLEGEELERRESAWQERYHARLIGADYRESMTIMKGKRPFSTKEGYLGMGPAEAEVGDAVVIFCGGRVPFVLRPRDGGCENMFAFVGEAYCDGVMDGEMLERGKKQPFFLQ